MTQIDTIQRQLIDQLGDIRSQTLNLSEYYCKSLNRTLDAAEYYLEIYRNCFERLLELCGKSPDEMVLVDYGGGHGILSVFAKRIGFGKVIYVDNVADTVDFCKLVSGQLSTAPDVLLCGDASTLKKWCEANNVVPDALVGIDVIEHVYVLDDFFSSLFALSPRMKMVLTTASNPENKRSVSRLHKVMVRDEHGSLIHNGFRQQRREYIHKLHPDMSESLLDYWADNTRGLIYDDVAHAIDSQTPNLLLDKYNTCDPSTGSWTERIIPFDDYRQLLLPYGCTLEVMPGFYNVHRHGIKAWIGRRRNRRIVRVVSPTPKGFRQRRRYRKALQIAPFVYLVAIPQ